jgi:hypothetical protein
MQLPLLRKGSKPSNQKMATKNSPPRRPPHRVPRAKTPCGPKSNSGAPTLREQPRRPPKVVLLGYISTTPSPTPRWPVGHCGAAAATMGRPVPSISRSKTATPWWGVGTKTKNPAPRVARSLPGHSRCRASELVACSGKGRGECRHGRQFRGAFFSSGGVVYSVCVCGER